MIRRVCSASVTGLRRLKRRSVWSAVSLALMLGASGRQGEAATLADYFLDATPLTGVTNAAGSNALATAEAFEPAHAGEPANHSLWAVWTPAVTGTYSISTSNSLSARRLWLDTVLGIYTGNALSNLTPVVSNDDADAFISWSRVVFRAYAGEKLYIAVDSVGTNGIGSINLNIASGGLPMGPWTAYDLNGGLVSSADYSNQVLLVDFWETTCSTCVQELPELVRLYETLHPRGFSLVGLAADPNTQVVRDYLSTRSVSYPMAMSTVSASNSLGGPIGFPTKYLVDQDGKIVGRFEGAAPAVPPATTPDPFGFYSSAFERLTRPSFLVSLVRALVTLDSGNVKISWPATESGYQLERAGNATAATWDPVDAEAETIDGRYVVTLPVTGEAQFFRLRKP